MIEEHVADLDARTHWASYLYTAMARATYEILPDGEGIYAKIPGFQGVWANEPTFDECRVELESALEDWGTLHLDEGLDLPELPGVPTPATAWCRRLARYSI